MTESEAVAFDEVSIGFNGNPVHEHINFSVETGDSVTLLGPSGTGKTVILKLIVGLLKPLGGKVQVFNQNISSLDEEELQQIRARVGFLFQGAALFDSLSVYENVAYPLRERGEKDEQRIEGLVIEKLKLVGLDSKRSQYPAELSGGQKKRIGLARALASEPQLMLFDEPTTGLDPTSARNIDSLIIRLNEEHGMTTISVTHDIESARKISKRWILFADGEKKADGLARELEANDPAVRDFVTGNWRAEL